MTTSSPIARFAIVFPGQGSQSVGMASNMLAVYPSLNATFDEASDALGYDILNIIENEADTLNQTEYTQPALLTTAIAYWRLWRAEGGATPSVVFGHSLGEYTALVAANALSLADAVRLVRTRGQLMQKAVPEGQGAMAAILGLDDARVEAICMDINGSDGVVAPANYNAPGQVVVSGNTAAVHAAITAAKAAGAKRAVLLPVSVPSHCPLMKDAATALNETFATINWQLPTIPVLHNVDAHIHPTTEAIHAALLAQLSGSVRWTDCVRNAAAMGITHMLECGPNNVLTGLNKRIGRDINDTAITFATLNTPADMAHYLDTI